MMDSSEQCVYDNDLNPLGDLNPEEESVVVEAPGTLAIGQEESENGPEVYGFLQMQDSEEATLILQQNGQQFYFDPSNVEGEYYVVVHEPVPGEAQVVTLEGGSIKQDLAIEEESLPEEISHNIESHESVNNELQGTVVYENTDNNQVGNLGGVKYLPIREVSNGVAYTLTLQDSHSPEAEEGVKNENLLNLAAVAQEIQSAGEHSATVEYIKDLKSQSVTEGSVIVTSIYADADSASMHQASETEEDTATDLASEHDSRSGFCEASADHNVKDEAATMEKQTSFSCISSTRTVDNTVSVIHTTSSTYIHDDLAKSVESGYIADDYKVKQKLDDVNIAECEQSEDSVPALQANLIHDNCSNQTDKFSNQDEDSILSENCGLDLTKESTIVNPTCDDDSLPAVEHSRSRYGIMDALNKDKRISYYDTNTSEEIDDTINSSSRSTNITDDGESVTENNLNELESNSHRQVVSEKNLSPERLSAEYENSSVKLDTKAIETHDKDSLENFQNCKTEKEIGNVNKGLPGTRRRRTFYLAAKDNSNSKSSAFSGNVASPSLLTTELNSVNPNLSRKEKAKAAIDAYEFEDTSTNEDKDSNPHTLLDSQSEDFEGEANSKVSATKTTHTLNNEENTQKLTFHEALSSVLGKEESDKKTVTFDGSADLFDNTPEMEENDVAYEGQEEIPSDHEDINSEHENILNGNEYEFQESINTHKAFDEPGTSEMNVVSDLMDTEESCVKTPQKQLKTYTRKRKLNQKETNSFSCNDVSYVNNSETLFKMNTQKSSGSFWKNPDDEFAIDDDNLESNVKSKVSATYKHKRKRVSSVIRANRARSLRPRSMQADESVENEAVDSSLCDLEGRLTSQEKVDSEEANWGAYLLGTQFSSKPTSTEPPTSSSQHTPNNSQPLRERKRPAWFTGVNPKKSQLTSGKQFDKLIKSSPTKVKATATDKKKLRDKIKRQAMSRCNNLSSHSAHTQHRRGRPKMKIPGQGRHIVSRSNSKVPWASNRRNSKKSSIKYLDLIAEAPDEMQAPDETSNVKDISSVSNEGSAPNNNDKIYTCCNCSFSVTRVNSLVMHMKFCSNKDNLEHQYNHKEVTDLKKLQRLRGDDSCNNLDTSDITNKQNNKDTVANYFNSTTIERDDQPGCSYTLERRKYDKNKEDAAYAAEKFGFSKRDVVWVKKEKRYWPALIWDIKDKDTLLYVITSPTHCELLTIASESIEKLVHTFDDAIWASQLLERAKKLPDHSNFIKAVQKANSYIRKKLLNDSEIDPRTFFNIEAEVDVYPYQDEGVEYPYTTETDITTKAVDVGKIMKFICAGKCDEHVVSIYHNKIPSERHKLFNKDKFAKELEDMSWFGPFKMFSSMQLQLYDRFYDLYKKEIDSPPNISYIYKVWIPEGIIKAISLVKNISFDEAELIFLKQETVDHSP